MRYSAFGVTVESELAWPGCPPTLEAQGEVVRLREVAMASLGGGDEGDLIWSATVDGHEARMLRRHDGGHLLEYGTQARFAIGPNHDEILVGVGSAPDPGWQRFMLDWVLLVVSHLHGYDLLHGAAVDFGGRAVAVLGPWTSGRSTLAAELVARGFGLVADDNVALDDATGEILVHPGPPVMSVPASTDVWRLGKVEVLGRIGDEQWVSVGRDNAGPLPLGAIVLLRRESRRAPSVQPVTATVVDLLGYSVSFEQSHDRDLRRFHLMADVASTVPVLALEAQLAAEPARLAGLIEAAVKDALAASAPEA